MRFATSLLPSCLNLFWPATCASCHALLPSDAEVFCTRCSLGIDEVATACSACALPLPDAGPSYRCAGCACRDFAFTRAYAAYEYGESLAAAIVRMKHGGRAELAGRLGRLMVPTLARAILDEDQPCVDAVLPVPLHPRKLRRRGFNQSLELAKAALGRLRGALARLPTSVAGADRPLPALERQLLVRVRDTGELGHLGPAARAVQVYGAFAVSKAARVVGQRFLVVDDVMTTGATLNECAEALRLAGAADVRVLALARVR